MTFRAAAAALALAVLAGMARQAPPPRSVLFLTHAGLYKHPSLEPAEAAVTEWGKSAGFAVTALTVARFTVARLAIAGLAVARFRIAGFAVSALGFSAF